jgi:hypothetical protein
MGTIAGWPIWMETSARIWKCIGRREHRVQSSRLLTWGCLSWGEAGGESGTEPWSIGSTVTVSRTAMVATILTPTLTSADKRYTAHKVPFVYEIRLVTAARRALSRPEYEAPMNLSQAHAAAIVRRELRRSDQ